MKFKHYRETGTIFVRNDGEKKRRNAQGSLARVLKFLVSSLEQGHYYVPELLDNSQGLELKLPITITIDAKTDGYGLCANMNATLEADCEPAERDGIHLQFDDVASRI